MFWKTCSLFIEQNITYVQVGKCYKRIKTRASDTSAFTLNHYRKALLHRLISRDITLKEKQID